MVYNLLEYLSIMTTVIIIVMITNRTLQYLQQSHYRISGFWTFLDRFYIKNPEHSAIILLLPLAFFLKHWFILLGYFLLSLLFIFYVKKKKDTIPLKFTARIERTYGFIVLLHIIFGTLFSLLVSFDTITSVLGMEAILSPFFAFLSFLMMKPIEWCIYQWYKRKAQKKRLQVNPKIIAITGSYGKTTTKNYLYELLKYKYMVVQTPKSYNTPNGICLTINETMQSMDEIFICEAGASKLGDIEQICKLIHPSYGIVTEIGRQHLETFHSIDSVAKEKMKLIECLPKEGVGVINVDNPHIRDYALNHQCKLIRIGIYEEHTLPGQTKDVYAKDIQYGKTGLEFRVVHQKGELTVKTQILGRHQIYNLLACIAMALEFGIEHEEIERQINTLVPVKNRLELKMDDNITIIDDSFNSNEIGFLNALEVLSFFDGKKILITPGIVEAGKYEEEMNQSLAEEIKNKCDYVIFVRTQASKYISEGLEKLGFQEYLFVETYQMAMAHAKEMISNQAGAILVENDVSDIYKI